MKPVADVILHEEGGEAFLLHVPSGRYFGLNEAGLVVWKALEAGEDPADELGRVWPDIAPDDRRADADALVQALAGAGLVDADQTPGSLNS